MTASIEAHWGELVTTALLGTDRRDPPAHDGPLGDLDADTARSLPSERMLAQIAACTAIRRAAVLPGAPVAPLAPPATDERRECTPAAVDRWHHISASWQVLEDEWMLSLISNRWRLAPELVPVVLGRYRRDPVRYARAMTAAGPLASWLVEHLPDLGCPREIKDFDPELSDLPIPPDLLELLSSSGAEIGRVVGTGLEQGGYGHAHKAVLVNLVARIPPVGLADLATVLDAVDPRSAGHGLATVLADLASTRHRMLDELRTDGASPSDR